MKNTFLRFQLTHLYLLANSTHYKLIKEKEQDRILVTSVEPKFKVGTHLHNSLLLDNIQYPQKSLIPKSKL